MFLYWFLVIAFILFFFLVHLNKINYKNSVLLILLFVFFFLIVVFRPLDVPDTESYKLIFDIIDEMSFKELFRSVDLLRKEINTGTEFGFVFLIKTILIFVPNNYILLFLIISLIEFFFIWQFAIRIAPTREKRIDYLFYFLPYFGLMYFLVVLRGGLCLAICLFAFSLTKSNQKYFAQKIVASLLLYIVAFTIHRFAFIFVLIELIYFVLPVFKKKRAYCLAWVIIGGIVVFLKFFAVGVLSNLLINVFSSNEMLSHYVKYLIVDDNQVGFSFRSLYFWLLGGLALFGCTESEFARSKKYFNIYLIGLIVMGLFSFAPGTSRIGDYMFAFIPVVLINITYNIEEKKNRYNLILASEIIFSVLGVIIIMRL